MRFLTIKDLASEMGISERIAAEIFNRKDFPCCDYGKSKVVEESAAMKFFSVPRRKKRLYDDES